MRSLLDEIAKAESEAAGDTADDWAELARQAEQMSRMPQPSSAFTTGMGVRLESTAGDQTGPPPKPTVTVLPAGSAPRAPDRDRP